MTIRVAGPFAGEAVRRDGILVDRGAWDVPIPVDPGVHAIAAEGPGHSPWSTSIEVKDAGKTVAVEVPQLVAVESPVSREPVRPKATVSADGSIDKRPNTGATQRLAGLIVGGAGLAAMGVSGALTLVANSQFQSAEHESGTARLDDSIRAGHLADVATVVVAAGSAVTVAGALVWLTAPKSPVSVGSNGRDVFMFGTFQ